MEMERREMERREEMAANERAEYWREITQGMNQIFERAAQQRQNQGSSGQGEGKPFTGWEESSRCRAPSGSSCATQ